MIRSVYARVEVEGPKFVAAHLSADARELGLTVALPEEVAMASPAGGVPGRIRTCDLPLRRRLLCPLSYGDRAFAKSTRDVPGPGPVSAVSADGHTASVADAMTRTEDPPRIRSAPDAAGRWTLVTSSPDDGRTVGTGPPV